jgi:hypothetical protein
MLPAPSVPVDQESVIERHRNTSPAGAEYSGGGHDAVLKTEEYP